MRPDFIVIGAMKAGTTALFQYLRKHPQVFMPWRKELDFFSNEGKWGQGVTWYEEQFTQARPGQRIGEASPNYSKRHLWPETPTRLAQVLPDAQIIYMVRDPIMRLQSMYLDMLYYGGETRSISTATIDTDYVTTSRYGMQIEPYVEMFGPERVLVETSERLRADPSSVLGRVLRFLDVDPAAMPALDSIEANPSESKRIPTRLGRYVRRFRPDAVNIRSPDDIAGWDRLLVRQSSYQAVRIPARKRQMMYLRFLPDVRRLQELVEVDLSDWTWLEEL